MAKVYVEIPMAPDKLLGHVNEDGEVYRSRVGLDDRVGTVDLSSGKIYADRFGPDNKVGYVDLDNGKVYFTRVGIDEYAGRVDGDGRMYSHVPLAADEYVGNVDRFMSYAHSAGAMLLLVLPALDESEE